MCENDVLKNHACHLALIPLCMQYATGKYVNDRELIQDFCEPGIIIR